MKIKTTYSTKKDFQKLRENGFKLNVGDKIRLSFCLPGKEGLYPPVECHKEGATLVRRPSRYKQLQRVRKNRACTVFEQ